MAQWTPMTCIPYLSYTVHTSKLCPPQTFTSNQLQFNVLPSNSGFTQIVQKYNFHPHCIQGLMDVQRWQLHTHKTCTNAHLTHSLYVQRTCAGCSRFIKELSNTTDASAFAILSNHTLPTRALHGAGLHSWGGSAQAINIRDVESTRVKIHIRPQNTSPIAELLVCIQ